MVLGVKSIDLIHREFSCDAVAMEWQVLGHLEPARVVTTFTNGVGVLLARVETAGLNNPARRTRLVAHLVAGSRFNGVSLKHLCR